MVSTIVRGRSALSRILLGCLALSAVVCHPAWSLAPLPERGRDVAVEPRPLTAVDRAGVELALEYFERGPSAWWDRLSSTSLLRELPERDALAEIEVRAGVARGADWKLQTPIIDGQQVIFTIQFPSGQDEALELTLVEEDGWKIQSIRSLEDPSTESSIAELVAAVPPVSVGPTSVGSRLADVELLPRSPFAAWWLLLLFLAGGTALVFVRRGSPRWHLGLFALASLLLIPGCRSGEQGEGEKNDSPADLVLLGDLLPLRKALTGASMVDTAPLFEAAPTEGHQGTVVQAWRAAQLAQEFRLDAAQEILDGLEEPLPLADLLRARIAALRGDVRATPKLYDHAFSRGIDHDGLRLEAADTLSYLGIDDDAEVHYRHLGELGSREVEVYYNLARLAALMDDREGGEQYFERGWALEPVERAELFHDPLLAWLCTRDRLFSELQLDRVDEPAVASPLEDRDPMPLPSDVRARISGNTLRLSLLGADLVVPGGGILAGPEVPTAPADAVTRRANREALEELEQLKRVGGEAIDRPLARQQRMAAAEALFDEKRWAELIELTEDMEDEERRLDPLLAQYRARALTEAGDDDRALRLLIRLARGNLKNRLTAPATLYQLAEIMVERRQFDLAIRLLERAESTAVQSFAKQRLRQVRMMKDLAEDSKVYTSEHFEVHYPPATGERYARQIAVILEEEFDRLQRWIPLTDPESIAVDLFPIRRFMSSYANGISVVGIYDGRVRVPFADLRSLHPEVIAILSHELAHAMTAQATGDQAPRWFQEGLAQHIEMIQNGVNPVPDLHAANRSLSLPVVQAILGGFAELQFVDLSYSQSAWSVHYIESAHGRRGIHELIQAFDRGEDTKTAFESALNTTIRDFDQAFRDWSLEEAPAVWPTQLRRYDEEAYLAEVTGEGENRLPSLAGGTFGRGKPSPLFSSQDSRSMRDWHYDYTKRVSAVRKRLAPVIAFVRSGRPDPEIGQACAQLSIDLNRLLHDRAALESSDPAVNRHLRSAFQSFERMTRACQRGQATEMQIQLKQGELALGAAARALKDYGLTP